MVLAAASEPPRCRAMRANGLRMAAAAESVASNCAPKVLTLMVRPVTSLQLFAESGSSLPRMISIHLCYGASRSVYPSGMCRDMAAGLEAYNMQMGKPAGLEDMVNIFESGPDVEVATVEAAKGILVRVAEGRD